MRDGRDRSLFRLQRALRELWRELRRLDDETCAALEDELDDLAESTRCLVARLGQLAGADDEEIARLFRRGDGE